MACIKCLGSVITGIFLARDDTHVVIILLFEDPDELIRDVARDLYGRTLDKGVPLIKAQLSEKI